MLSFQSWEHTTSAAVSENNNPFQNYIVHISCLGNTVLYSAFLLLKIKVFHNHIFNMHLIFTYRLVLTKQGFWISFSEHCVQLHYLQYHSSLHIYPPTVTTNTDTKKGSYSPHSHSPESFTVGKGQSHLHFITRLKEFESAGQCQREFRLYACFTHKCCSSLALDLYLSSSTCFHARFTSHRHLAMAKTTFSSR